MLVVGVALALVAAVTGLQPHLVTGVARATPVPGPPAVGDCILDRLPGPALGTVTITPNSGGTVPVYPAQQIRPCTTARYGEITAVIAAPKPTVVKGDADNRYLDDPNEDSCFPAAIRYVGTMKEPILGLWQTDL